MILAPLVVHAEAEVKVDTGKGTFEMKTGPEKEPEKTVVIEKQTTVRPKYGCSCQLDSGHPCQK